MIHFCVSVGWWTDPVCLVSVSGLGAPERDSSGESEEVASGAERTPGPGVSAAAAAHTGDPHSSVPGEPHRLF